MPLVFLAGLLSAVLWYFGFSLIAAICGYLSFISFTLLCCAQALFVILIATGYKVFLLPTPTGLIDHAYLLGPALGGAVATYMILLAIIFFGIAIGARFFDSKED